MNISASGLRPFKIDIFLQDGFALSELAAIVEVVENLRKLDPGHNIHLELTSSKGGEISASDARSIVDTVPLQLGTGIGLLVLVGSVRPDTRALLSVYSKARAYGRFVLVLSEAVLALHRHGAFGTEDVCIPWTDAIDHESLHRLEGCRDSIYSITPSFATCAGRFSTPHALLSVLAARFGIEAATRTAERCMLGALRSSNAPQRINARERYRVENPKVVALIENFEKNFSEPLSMPDVSVLLGLSTRQVERVCRAELGISPTRLLEDIRLRWAWWYIEYTSAPITEIAYTCGFGSPGHMTKVFRKRYGRSPRYFRENALQASATPLLPASARRASSPLSQSGSISGTEESKSSV